MAIISISIPDDLKAQLEKIKDNINVSKVCQKALGNKVIQLSSIPKDVKQFEALIYSLRDSKQEFENEWYSYGFRDGVKDSERMNYAEIKQLIDYEHLEEEKEHELFLKYEDGTPDGFEIDYETWERGYIDGIKSIYDKIEHFL